MPAVGEDVLGVPVEQEQEVLDLGHSLFELEVVMGLLEVVDLLLEFSDAVG